jgi:hypothetical protein
MLPRKEQETVLKMCFLNYLPYFTLFLQSFHFISPLSSFPYTFRVLYVFLFERSPHRSFKCEVSIEHI